MRETPFTGGVRGVRVDLDFVLHQQPLGGNQRHGQQRGSQGIGTEVTKHGSSYTGERVRRQLAGW